MSIVRFYVHDISTGDFFFWLLFLYHIRYICFKQWSWSVQLLYVIWLFIDSSSLAMRANHCCHRLSYLALSIILTSELWIKTQQILKRIYFFVLVWLELTEHCDGLYLVCKDLRTKLRLALITTAVISCLHQNNIWYWTSHCHCHLLCHSKFQHNSAWKNPKKIFSEKLCSFS